MWADFHHSGNGGACGGIRRKPRPSAERDRLAGPTDAGATGGGAGGHGNHAARANPRITAHRVFVTHKPATRAPPRLPADFARPIIAGDSHRLCIKRAGGGANSGESLEIFLGFSRFRFTGGKKRQNSRGFSAINCTSPNSAPAPLPPFFNFSVFTKKSMNARVGKCDFSRQRPAAREQVYTIKPPPNSVSFSDSQAAENGRITGVFRQKTAAPKITQKPTPLGSQADFELPFFDKNQKAGRSGGCGFFPVLF